MNKYLLYANSHLKVMGLIELDRLKIIRFENKYLQSVSDVILLQRICNNYRLGTEFRSTIRSNRINKYLRMNSVNAHG